MHRAGSLTKLRVSLQSSGKRLAKAFSRNAAQPPPSSGLDICYIHIYYSIGFVQVSQFYMHTEVKKQF